MSHSYKLAQRLPHWLNFEVAQLWSGDILEWDQNLSESWIVSNNNHFSLFNRCIPCHVWPTHRHFCCATACFWSQVLRENHDWKADGISQVNAKPSSNFLLKMTKSDFLLIMIVWVGVMLSSSVVDDVWTSGKWLSETQSQANDSL